MVKYKDITVPLLKSDVDSRMEGYERHNFTLRVFYDDSWAAGKRDAIVFFSGGTGLNVQTETSTRPVYTVSQGCLHMDAMSVPDNYVFYRNINFPNVEFPGKPAEVAAFIKVIESLHQDPVIGKYFTSDASYALLGHSRGGGLLLDWASIYTISPTYHPLKTLRIKSIVLNSPMGSGEGGYAGYDRFFRMGAKAININNFPRLIYTVGEGDKTHTNRAMMERLYRFGLVQSKIDFQVVGDSTYTHDYPTTTTNNQYKVFLDFGINSLKGS